MICSWASWHTVHSSTSRHSATDAQQTAARLHAQITEADRAIAMQVRALEQGIEPDMVRPESMN